jgi:serine/threonine protein kinase
MWSYGVTAYGLCFFEFPFECDDEKLLSVQAMKKAIEQNLAPRCLENGGGMAAFIRPLLEPCKSARCTVEAALVHWYLQEDASASQSSSVSPRTPQPRCSSTASEASTQVGPNFEQAAAKARDSTNTCCSTPSLLDDASWSV